ncbi:MAG: DUF1574 family protein [Candidatus Melainabacteria bacterium]|nr:DUF1574 family protein [Candidatus Melainabacteria bacterium]
MPGSLIGDKKNSNPSPKDRPLTKKECGVVKLVCFSSFCWTIIILITAEIAVRVSRPLRFVKVPGIILQDQDPIAEEVSILRTGSSNTNTLLLGTSLLRNVTAFADAAQENRHLTSDSWNRYFQAKTLDRLLKSNFDLNAKSLNIFVGGGFFYDSWLLLEIAVKSKHPPKFVILTVAPKDFLDSTRPLSDSHVKLSLKLRAKDLEEGTEISATSLANKFSRYYQLKSEYRCILETMVCSALGRAPSIYAALNGTVLKGPKVELCNTDEAIDMENHLAEAETATLNSYYSSVYESSRRETLCEQTKFLEQALSLLKEQNIKCLVVAMPLSKKHAEVLPTDLANAFTEKLAETCSTAKVCLFDLTNDQRFRADDYHDLVHLNKKGSLKFWDVLIEELKKAKLLSPSFTNNFNN